MKRRYINENANFTVEDILAIIEKMDPEAADVIGTDYIDVLNYYVTHDWESVQGAAENIYTVYNYGFDPELCLKMAKEVNKLYTGDSMVESTAKKKKKYTEDELNDMQDFIDDCIEVIE